MSLRIIKAGLLDTIQDLGRFGFLASGINPSGAMDRYALQLANALVGNAPGEAGIELHFPASVILFTRPALIALSGADFSPSINGEPVPMQQGIVVNKNDALQFHRPVKGARAYIAVAGGFQLEDWLGSYSTNLKAVAGGFHGRRLQKGDEIVLNGKKEYGYLLPGKNFRVLPWAADNKYEEESSEIAVLPGHEWGRLTEEARERLLHSPFLITKLADRMGYRLGNEPLSVLPGEDILSSAVNRGTIQLLPDGKLIVLMADHQTTGGYPRIAHVITADHSKLAQLKSGDSVYFRLTDMATAEEKLTRQQQHLRQLQHACTLKLQQYG